MAGKGRTGAPLYAQIINKACKLSHGARFQGGLQDLLGADFADIWAAWTSFCLLWETFLSQDDYPFETDFTSPAGPGDPL